MSPTPDPDRLSELMVRMAAGDGAAVFTLVDEYGGTLAGVVRRHLVAWGRTDLLRNEREVDHLVQTAALVLFDRAAAWRPGGAPPWVWAAAAIRHALAREIGHPTVELDPERHDRAERRLSAAGGHDLDLDLLARRHPGVARFRAVLHEVSSARDRAVVEAYLLQQALGSPSPATIVAAETGLSPANVRQIVCRARRRVRQRVGIGGGSMTGTEGWLGA